MEYGPIISCKIGTYTFFKRKNLCVEFFLFLFIYNLKLLKRYDANLKLGGRSVLDTPFN